MYSYTQFDEMKEGSFFRRIFSSRILPSWTILMFDSCIIIVSLLLAYIIRFSLVSAMKMGTEIRISFLVVLLLNIIFFRLFKTYSNILRLSSFVDVMHIFVALTLAYLISGAVSLLWPLLFSPKFSFAQLSVLMISYVISFMLLATSRMVIKMLNDYFNQSKGASLNTYIYGTQAGVDIAKSLRTEADNRFRIVGFVADAPDMIGQTAFRDVGALMLISRHVPAYGSQKINVPAFVLFMREMPRYPLIETVHGAAYIAICPGLKIDAAEGSDLRPDRLVETEEEDVRPLSDHFFLLSSSSTSERVLIRMIVLLSSILDSDILAMSVSLRP